MNRVTEFHNIMPIANIASVLQYGLLSHEQASSLNHHDISLAKVQDERDQKSVPGGFTLHSYANAYFHARNPMMYLRQNEAENLCILRISRSILNIAGVVVPDQNAASRYVRFLAPYQMNQNTLDLDKIYADDWQHEDQIEYWRRKSRKCAEVLVPNRIPVAYIQGAYVVNQDALVKLTQHGFVLPIQINEYMFFR